MVRVSRFFRTMVQVRHADIGAKRADVNGVTWWHWSLGRWDFAVTTVYEGERYGYLGSDTTVVSLRVTRNPEGVIG